MQFATADDNREFWKGVPLRRMLATQLTITSANGFA